MELRVVDESSFTFKTDLPPSSRNIHPSGVLHAFRSTAPSSSSTLTSISTNNGSRGREEHTFAWINNSLHIDAAVNHLETFGFTRSHNGIVFIPYSTKRNWLDRYPHAAPAIETMESGQVVVYLNWRPYPNGLSDIDGGSGEYKSEEEQLKLETAQNIIDSGETSQDFLSKVATKTGERVYKNKRSRALNILRDNSFLPDAERDELHVEIYNYLKWLHGKLSAIEEKDNKADDYAAAAMEYNPESKKQKKGNHLIPGVNVSELGNVVTKLECAFMVIPNMNADEASGHDGDTPVMMEGRQTGGSAPFLEEALSIPLKQLVSAREVAGKPKRRSRKRPRRSKVGDPNKNPRCKPRRTGQPWDEMFQKLVQYKEEHGSTAVPFKYKDSGLANWVRSLRDKRARMVKDGIEVETVPPGKGPLAKTLTAERIARLDSIDFVWVVTAPIPAWDDRFEELMEYYNTHGKWPSQSCGPLGLWVNKQRQKYKRGDEGFMKYGALKLDAVGFEWTPRGNTRMSWDEGFHLLMEFGKENGHYDVIKPTGSNVDIKSDEYRLYNWVQSLHAMYRSYKLGRRSGSLTDERVVLLIRHGFQFRQG